jgi:hypothetical protein
LQLVFNQYFKALLMIALSTVIFVAVNNLISVLPEGLVISPQGARVVTSTTPSSPSESTTIYNISYVDNFNEISSYWVSLDPTITWYTQNGVLRATLSSEGSLNNVLYYSVDLIEENHTVIKLTARSYLYYDDQRQAGVVLLSRDLVSRLYVTFRSARPTTYIYEYYRIVAYHGGVVQEVAGAYYSADSVAKAGNSWITYTVEITRISETQFNISISIYVDQRGASYSITKTVDFGVSVSFDYFGVAIISGSDRDGIEYVEAWILSEDATETVYYNVNTPPPCPCECPECPCMEGEVYIPLRLMGQFVAFTSYILFIVTALKNIMPEL